MVKFDIFLDAAEIYETGEVWFLGMTDKAANFLVKDVPVRLEITPTGTRFQCQCEHHKHHMLQDKLCKRVLAVIMYVYFKRGKLKAKQ
jgi:hypothetical protein